MESLLITSQNSSKEIYGKLSSIRTLYSPFSLAYIAAYVEKQRHEVKVVDSEAENYNFEDINEIALKFRPDLVCMQTYLTTLNKSFALVKAGLLTLFA